jgi:hypothetical protein
MQAQPTLRAAGYAPSAREATPKGRDARRKGDNRPPGFTPESTRTLRESKG